MSVANYKKTKYVGAMDRIMVFNTTFNNISVISWRAVLLVEETGVLRQNHCSVASHWQNFYVGMSP